MVGEMVSNMGDARGPEGYIAPSYSDKDMRLTELVVCQNKGKT
jgi:hypothetical protein